MALKDGSEAVKAQRFEAITASRARGWYWRTLFSYGGVYFHVVLIAVIGNFLALALPLFAIAAFDRFIPSFSRDTVWLLAIGLAAVFAFDFILKALRGYLVDSVSHAISGRIGDRLFERLLVAKISALRDIDDLLPGLANDIEDVQSLLSAKSVQAIIDLPFVCIFIVAIYAIAGSVALIPLCAIAAILFFSLVLQLPLRVMLVRTRDAIRKRLRFAGETLASLETLKSTASEMYFQRRWEDLSELSESASRRAQGLSNWIGNLTATASAFVTAGVIIHGVLLVNGGTLSIGGLVAISMLAVSAMAPLGRIAAILVIYHRGRIAIEAINVAMQLPAERSEDDLNAEASEIQGSISFQNVSFCYPGQETNVLESVTFQIQAGEKVGLIGRIGSGKSTLARLVMGLYEPVEGVVTIDGSDLQKVDPADLRANIGYLTQDVRIFGGSVRDNIALGFDWVDDESIHRVARIAGVDEFTAKHPLGYGMPVGERGQLISMGQKQAIGIARTLLRDPSVLLFDEPTASLDNTSEGRVRARLANTMKNKTLIMITNRASMLSLVDRLIVVDGGKIIADGAKQEVLDGLQGGHIQAVQGFEER